MEAKSDAVKTEVNPNFKLLDVKDGKYHVKFPFVDIPIEMNEAFYNQLIKRNINKHSLKSSSDNVN